MFKRLTEDKRLILFLAAAGLAALVALAGTLNRVAFKPAAPLYREKYVAATGEFSFQKATELMAEIPLWKQIALLAAIVLFMALSFSLLSPEARKRLLRMLVRGTLAILALIYLLKTNPDLLKNLFPQISSSTAEPSAALDAVAPPVFEPPQISETFSFWVAFGIALACVASIWLAYRWGRRMNAASNADSTLDDIAKAARSALNELPHTASPDAIIRCYEKMSAAVFARRGLQRNYAATAAEFARQLENAGLPHEPVRRLTRLFESARYSLRPSTQADVDEAVICLTAILKHCGETA